MTREDIIRLAQDAGLLDKVDCSDDYFIPSNAFLEEIECFATLVATAERERLDLNAIHTCHPECPRPVCVSIREAVAHEREACAEVSERHSKRDDDMGAIIAAAIRARGNK